MDVELAKARQTEYQELMRAYVEDGNRAARDEALVLLYDICCDFIPALLHHKVPNAEDRADIASETYAYHVAKTQRRIDEYGVAGISQALYADIRYSLLTTMYGGRYWERYHDTKMQAIVRRLNDANSEDLVDIYLGEEL